MVPVLFSCQSSGRTATRAQPTPNRIAQTSGPVMISLTRQPVIRTIEPSLLLPMVIYTRHVRHPLLLSRQ